MRVDGPVSDGKFVATASEMLPNLDVVSINLSFVHGVLMRLEL